MVTKSNILSGLAWGSYRGGAHLLLFFPVFCERLPTFHIFHADSLAHAYELTEPRGTVYEIDRHNSPSKKRWVGYHLTKLLAFDSCRWRFFSVRFHFVSAARTDERPLPVQKHDQLSRTLRSRMDCLSDWWKPFKLSIRDLIETPGRAWSKQIFSPASAAPPGKMDYCIEGVE